MAVGSSRAVRRTLRNNARGIRENQGAMTYVWNAPYQR